MVNDNKYGTPLTTGVHRRDSVLVFPVVCTRPVDQDPVHQVLVHQVSSRNSDHNTEPSVYVSHFIVKKESIDVVFIPNFPSIVTSPGGNQT